MTALQQRTVVLAALAAAVVLLLTAPAPTASLAVLADPSGASTPSAPLVALVALLAWGLAAYLLVVTALTAGAHLPGTGGRALAAVARRSAPSGLRRALEVALGVTLAVGALGGTAGAAPLAPEPPASASVTLDHPVSHPVPSLDHPVAGRAVVPEPTPSLDHPAAPPTAAAARAARPEPPAPAPAEATLPATSADSTVVVQRGDSLWSLAEDRLGPQATDAQVAQAWPAWWQANRELIGDDPDLLLPGTPLTPPTDRP